MQLNSYKETIDWLFQQFPAYHKIGAPAYKPTLDNCRKLCALFNNPEKDLKFIHIAGTNGKGSTSSMLASILKEAGYKTGLFTSPHLVDFRERIRVNGEMISETDVIDFCKRVRGLNLDFEPSFFEITFIMTLDHFQKQKCDLCVIETGLGGRLDATNVISPILSIVTNIGLEHTNFLGDTLEKIATEKAGIIKYHIPIVIGETLPETKPIFSQVAKSNSAPIYFAEENDFDTPSNFPFLGDYQKQNYRTVLTGLNQLRKLNFHITEKSIEKGLLNIVPNTGFRARLQVISQEPLLLFDVSHNLDGISATLKSLESFKKGTLHIVYGTSNDKDLESIFNLFPRSARYYFTEFASERSTKIEELKEYSEKNALEAKYFKKSQEALESAQSAANKEDTILAFGSFFLICEFF